MNLNKVGIENIRYPIQVREKSGGRQETIATIRLQATMPKEHRENCVSAVISILNRYQDNLSLDIFSSLIAEVKSELQAESAQMDIEFPYFIEKQAPISNTKSLMEYRCRFANNNEEKKNLVVSVWVPTTTLCPCSKEISDYGAHNQRAEINLNVQTTGFIWIEDLIAMAEEGSSCQVYSLLKRPDEKFVTEEAYNNPMFVEDVVRKVAELARKNKNIAWFSVGVESYESIHKHSAYAYVDSSEM